MSQHTIYYAPPDAFKPDGTVLLPDQEWHHAVQVMRCKKGDQIVVVDGVGTWCRVRLDGQRGRGEVVESRAGFGEPDRRLTMALGLLKSRKRFRTFLEKAVELGARKIIPLVTDKAQVHSLRLDRARRVLVAAMKQCGRCRIPELLPPQPLQALIRDAGDQRMIMCLQQSPVRLVPAAGDVTILVGPEGGFTEDEIALSVAAGVVGMSLSQQRLRAETAAIAAMAIAMLPVETGDQQGR